MKTKEIIGILLMIITVIIETAVWVYWLFNDMDSISIVTFLICIIIFIIGDIMSTPMRGRKK